MLSTRKINLILQNTQEWMEKKITVYEVSKRARCKWETANTYLHKFKPLIEIKEQEIIEKLTKPDSYDKRGGIFQKIKTRILSRILTAQSVTPILK